MAYRITVHNQLRFDRSFDVEVAPEDGTGFNLPAQLSLIVAANEADLRAPPGFVGAVFHPRPHVVFALPQLPVLHLITSLLLKVWLRLETPQRAHLGLGADSRTVSIALVAVQLGSWCLISNITDVTLRRVGQHDGAGAGAGGAARKSPAAAPPAAAPMPRLFAAHLTLEVTAVHQPAPLLAPPPPPPQPLLQPLLQPLPAAAGLWHLEPPPMPLPLQQHAAPPPLLPRAPPPLPLAPQLVAPQADTPPPQLPIQAAPQQQPPPATAPNAAALDHFLRAHASLPRRS